MRTEKNCSFNGQTWVFELEINEVVESGGEVTEVGQVWSLTQFFLFRFSKKSMTQSGETQFSSSSQQLPRFRLRPLRAFWADTTPFKGPWLALCVAFRTTEIQGHHQVCRARSRGPRTPSSTTDANLDCAFVEDALIYTDPQLWKVNRIELS